MRDYWLLLWQQLILLMIPYLLLSSKFSISKPLFRRFSLRFGLNRLFWNFVTRWHFRSVLDTPVQRLVARPHLEPSSSLSSSSSVAGRPRLFHSCCVAQQRIGVEMAATLLGDEAASNEAAAAKEVCCCCSAKLRRLWEIVLSILYLINRRQPFHFGFYKWSTLDKNKIRSIVSSLLTKKGKNIKKTYFR